MDKRVKEALEAVCSEQKDGFAKTYASAALDYNMIGHELYVQCLYVLSNLQYWRGARAREVKAILKGVSKQ